MAALTDRVRMIIERQPTTTWRPRPASMGTGDETNIVKVILQVPSRYLQKKPTVIFLKVYNFASASIYSSSCISLVFWWDLAKSWRLLSTSPSLLFLDENNKTSVINRSCPTTKKNYNTYDISYLNV